MLSLNFCPVRDLLLCHVPFEDFHTKKGDMREGGWSVAGGLRCVVVLIVFLFVLDCSLGIPEGKKNPCSFFRSPSPPGEGSGWWWSWTFTMPTLVVLLNRFFTSDRAGLGALGFQRFLLILVLWILRVPPSLGRFPLHVAVSSSFGLSVSLFVTLALSSLWFEITTFRNSFGTCS